MFTKIYQTLFNRNLILIGAIIVGLVFSGFANTLKDYNFYILAVVMTLSTTGISMKGMLPISKSLKNMGVAIFLGYFVFSSLLIVLSWFLLDNKYLFYGMVIIAASPPGVAVIPFTHILKGDMNYTMVGTLGTYLASVILAPFIITLFSDSEGLDSMQLLIIMVKVILIPFLISRLLLFQPIYAVVEKTRGHLVDFGFALIIYTAVGLNREVFFGNFEVLALISFILLLMMFGLGTLYEWLARRFKIASPKSVSQKLLLTIKSSGFTASASMAIFGREAAIPSAVLAVLVLVYLLYLSIRNDIKQQT
ncbi:MAG: bile acid:sodium symporter family protein [Salinivirgaceae bacterium]